MSFKSRFLGFVFALCVAGTLHAQTIDNFSISVSNQNANVGDIVNLVASFKCTDCSTSGPKTNAFDLCMQIPSGYSYVSGTATSSTVQTLLDPINCTEGSVTGPGLIWNLIDLGNSNSTYTFTAPVTVQSGMSLTARAEIFNVASGLNFPSGFVKTVSGNQIDLSLAMVKQSAGTPNVGDNVEYRLTVTNSSTDGFNADGVSSRIYVPSGYSYSSNNSCSGSLSGTASSTITWTPSGGGGVNAGSSKSCDIVFTAQKTTATSGEYTMQAEVFTADEPDVDSTPGNGVASGEDDDTSLTVTPVQIADVDMTLAVSNSNPDVGNSVTMTLTLTNNGPSDIINGSVSAYVPSGYNSISSISNSGTTTATSNPAGCTACTEVNWTSVGLASGATTTRTFNVLVGTGSGGANDFLTTAEWVSIGAGITQLNDTAGNHTYPTVTEGDEDSTTINRVDVSLALGLSGGTTPDVNADFDLIVTASRSPSTPTENVGVCLTLPGGMTVQSSTITLSSIAGCANLWTISSWNTSSQVNTITLRAGQPASQTIIAEVITATKPDSDSVPNDGSGDDYASVSIDPPEADLQTTMSVNNDSPQKNDDVTYTITLTNAGPDSARNVVLRTRIPADLSYQSATISAGSCPSLSVGASSTNLDCTIGTMTNGEVATLTLVLRVSDSTNVLTESEVFSTPTFDTTSVPNDGAGDDYAAVNLTVQDVDLVVSPEGVPDSPVAGTAWSYQYRIANTSLVHSPSSLISEVVPVHGGGTAGFTDSGTWQCEAFNGACCHAVSNCGTSPSPTAPVSGPLNGVTMNLQANSYVIITVAGTLDASTSGTLTNSVTANGGNDTNAADNTNVNTLFADGVSTPLIVAGTADVRLSKTNTSIAEKSGGALKVGAITGYTLGYDILVSNDGPGAVTGMTVTDDFDGTVAGQPAFDPTTVSWNCVIEAPSGQTAVISQCQTGSGSGGPLSVLLDLDVGFSARISLTVDTDRTTGAVVNTASVAMPAGISDPILTNNTDSERVVLSGESALRVLAQGPVAVVAGTDMNYTFQVLNDGPDFAQGVVADNLFGSQVETVSWSCDASTPVPGDLDILEEFRQAGTIQGPWDAVFTSNGEHVYVISSYLDLGSDGAGNGSFAGAVHAFARETVRGVDFGHLTLLETEVDGVDDVGDSGGPVSHTRQPTALDLSPDERFLYVAGYGDAAIAWFERNTNVQSNQYGELTFRGFVQHANLAGIRDVKVSPDGKHVYGIGITSGLTVGHVVQFDRNAADGSLSFVASYDSDAAISGYPTYPITLEFGSGGRFLYVGSFSEGGIKTDRLTVLQREVDENAANFGELSPVQSLDAQYVYAMARTPDNKFLYVGSYGGDGIHILSIDAATGMLSEISNPATFVLPDIANIISLAVSPDGEHLLVGTHNPQAGIDEGAILSYRINKVTGELTLQENILDGVTLGSGLNAITVSLAEPIVRVSPDGQHVIALSRDQQSIDVFSRKAPDPILGQMELEIEGVNGVNGLAGASTIVVSNDGEFVYAGGLGGNGSIAAFARNPLAGASPGTQGGNLTFLSSYLDDNVNIDGLAGIVDMAFEPTQGNLLFTASEIDNAVSVFRKQPDGSLVYLNSYFDNSNGIDGLAGASAVATDPQGQFLYVAGRFDAAVAVFSIDKVSGVLTLVEVVRNSDPDVSGLSGPIDLVVAPDSGAETGQLIVAGSVADRVIVFDRDRATGTLSFSNEYGIGAGDRPMGLAVSAEGAHVYVTSANSHSISVFNRETDTSLASYGQLSLQAMYVDGVDVNGIRGARSVVVSPSGAKVFVAAQVDDSVLVFDRNTDPQSPDFGALTYVEKHTDGLEGIDGLRQIYQVVISPDNRDVYTVALGDQAISAFRLGEGSQCPASGSGGLSNVGIDVAVGGVVTFNVTAHVKSSSTVGTINNQFSVVPPAGFTDPDLANNSASVSTNLRAEADLSINKTNNRLSSIAGQNAVYDIVIDNSGPSDARNGLPVSVTVTDLLSAEPNAYFDTTNATWSCQAIGSGNLLEVDTEIDGINSVDGLLGATDVVFVANAGGRGTYVLASGLLEDSIAVFKQDSVTGDLSFEQKISNGDVLSSGTVSGLAGVRDLLVSADGNFLYAAAQIGDSVSVFSLSDGGSALSLDIIQTLTKNSISGLDQAVAMSMDASESSLYIAGARTSTIVYLSRNSGTGLLTLGAQYSNGSGGVQFMQNPVDLVVDAAGTQVFVVAQNSNSLVVFDRQAAGALTFNGSLTNGSTLNGQLIDGLEAPQSVRLSNDDTSVYVTGSNSNSLTVFSRQAGFVSFVQKIENGVGGVSGLVKPATILLTSDGFHLYVANRQSSRIVAFRVANDNSLSFINQVEGLALDGVNGLTEDPVGAFLYTASSGSNSVSGFSRVADSSCPSSGTGDINNVAVNVANGGQLIFTVDAPIVANAEGNLVNTATVSASIDVTTANNSSTDTDNLNPRADLSIVKYDQYIQFDGLQGAADVIATNDGQYVYAAASEEASISLWEKSATSLDYLGQLANGVDGVSGLNGVKAMAMDSSESYFYAVSALDGAVSMFDRDAATGQLVQQQDLRNDGNITGMNGAHQLLISHDGAHLYVLGETLGTVVEFSIDSNNGQLSYVQTYQNGLGGFSGLSQASDFVISNDDQWLIIASPNPGALTVLSRNADDQSAEYGDLSFEESYAGGSGLIGINGVRSLLIAPDSGLLYSSAPGSIAWFSIDAAGVLTQSGQLDSSGNPLLTYPDGGVMALDTAGDQFFIAAPGADLVNVLARQGDGSLVAGSQLIEGQFSGTPAQAINGLQQAQGLFVSTDRLYAAAMGSNALSFFDLTSMDYEGAVEDGGGGAAPGSVVTYHIVVGNAGPSDVIGAKVTDVFPDAYDQVSWSCAPTDPAAPQLPACIGNGQGDLLDSPINLPAGTSVEFIAQATLSSVATGMVINTATVTAPAGILDSNAANNQSTDDNTSLLPAVDLQVALSNSLGSLQAGAALNYVMTVNNSGPSQAGLVNVKMAASSGLQNLRWTCQADPAPGLLAATPVVPPAEMESIVDQISTQDGRFVYALGIRGGQSSIGIYARDSRSGDLSFRSAVTNGELLGGVILSGMSGANSFAMSPGGEHIYVAANQDDSILVFNRDSVNGSLSLNSQIIDGVNANGLAGVEQLIMSQDGRSVYASSSIDNGLALFTRNQITGALNFDAVILASTVPEVDQISRILMGPNGNFVYALSNANNRLLILSRNAASGSLTLASTQVQADFNQTIMLSPTDLSFDQNGRALLIAQGSSSLALLNINPLNGKLILVDTLFQSSTGVDGLQQPSRVIFNSAGTQAYVIDESQDAVSLYQIFDQQLSFSQAITPGVQPLFSTLRSIVLTADEHHLYVGGLAYNGFKVSPGSSCPSLGTGTFIHQASVAANGVLTYSIDATLSPAARGSLQVTASAFPAGGEVETNPADNVVVDNDIIDGISQVNVLIGPPDQLVAGLSSTYEVTLTNPGPAHAIGNLLDLQLPYQPVNQFGFDGSSLTLQCSDSGGFALQNNFSGPEFEGISAIRMSLDGQYLYVLSTSSAELNVYEINGSALNQIQSWKDGDEGELIQVQSLATGTNLRLAQDGQSLYVVSEQDNSLLVFTRDNETGLIEPLQQLVNGDIDLTGMMSPVDVLPSRDGTRVYVAASGSDAITVFNRDSASGALAYLGRVKDGFGSILPDSNVIRGVQTLIEGQNGQFIYALGSDSNAIATFVPQSQDIGLRFTGVLRSGASSGLLSVDNLLNPTAAVTTEDGLYLYVLAQDSNQIFVFTTDELTGELTLLQLVSPASLNIPEVVGLQSMVMTDDSSRIMLTGSDGHLLILHRNFASGMLSFAELRQDAQLATVKNMSLNLDGTQLWMAAGAQNDLLLWDSQAFGRCPLITSGTSILNQPFDLQSGGSITFTVGGLLHPSRRLDVPVQVDIFEDVQQVGSANRSDSVDIQTDIAVQLENLTNPAVAGTSHQVAVHVTNSGPSSVLPATLSLQTLGSWTINSWSCVASGGAICAGNGMGLPDGEAPEITPGDDVVYTFTGDIASDFFDQIQVDAQLVTEPGATEANLLDDTDQLIIDVTGVADVSLEVLSFSNPWVPGSNVSYEIRVANDGPSDSEFSPLSLPVPVQLQNVSIQCSVLNATACPTDGSSINNMVNLAVGESAVLEVSGNILFDDTSLNAQLTGQIDADSRTTDPVPANNTIAETANVEAQVDLEMLILVDSMDPYDPAGSEPPLVYETEYQSQGPSLARQAQIVWQIPPSFNVQSTTGCLTTQYTPGILAELLCTLPDVAPTGVNMASLTIIPDSTATLELHSVNAIISSAALETNVVDNQIIETTLFVSGPDLAVQQQGPSRLLPGDDFSLIIQVDNYGSIDALGVDLVDTLDDSWLQNISWQCVPDAISSCPASGTGVPSLVADIPATGHLEITLQATLDPAVDVSVVTQLISEFNANYSGTPADIRPVNNQHILGIEITDEIFSDGFEEQP